MVEAEHQRRPSDGLLAGHADGPPGDLLRAAENGHQHRYQQRQDRDDNQELDQREAGWAAR